MKAAIDERRTLHIALACITAITVVRIIALAISPLELHPDEAQYWWWSQTPAFGYFSKPPMVAWIIGADTSIFGNAEWAIRLASPLLHALTSIAIYAIGRKLFDGRIGLLSALAYLTTPGVSYSCGLMSTDVPLLFFWTVAVYAFLRMLDEKTWLWPVLCGAAIGLGLLSKYAMLYFIVGATLAALAIPNVRKVVFGWHSVAVLTIAFLVCAPNIWWNVGHSYSTIAHVGVNADWGHARFSLSHLAGFILGQFGVFGPILMAGYVGALVRLARGQQGSEAEVILAALSLPPLVLMMGQAFIANANANWAATAYIAASPLAVGELVRWWRGRALWASFAVNGLAMVVLLIFVTEPATAERFGYGNALKREEGWRQLGRKVAQVAASQPFDAVATDNRSMVAELLYYARPLSIPVRAWSRDQTVHDHFQMTIPLQRGTRRVLVVVAPQDTQFVISTFDSAQRVDSVAIPVGGHRPRVTELYDARGYRGPAAAAASSEN